jgi:hypothetical protein
VTIGDPAELAIEITERRKENAEQRKRYSWIERTEVKKKKKLYSRSVMTVRYSEDGEIERTLVTEPPDKRTRGAVRRAMKRQKSKRKMKEQREWRREFEELLARYSLPTAGNILDFLMAATVSPGDIAGEIRIRARNVVEPGDELTMWVDAETKQIKRTRILTHLKKETVMAEVDHRRVDGVRFAARKSVQVPSQKVGMVVESFEISDGSTETENDSTGDAS